MMKTRVLIVALLLLLATTGAMAQTKAHPYLFFTPERTDALKQRIKTDAGTKAAWLQVLAEADKALKEAKPTNRLDYLSLVYLVTGDKKYADKIKAVMEQELKRSTWDGGALAQRTPAWNAGLGTAHTNYAIANAYDAIYNYLAPQERAAFAKDIVRLGIEPSMGDWLSDNMRIHSLNSMGHNWWVSVVYMAGLSSLAVMHEVPEAAQWVHTISEAAREWFAFEGDVLHFKQRNFEHGGNYESVNYANFGLSEYLFFRLAWTNAFPGDKAPAIQDLELIPSFFMNTSYPRSSGSLYSLYFGDSSMEANGERPTTLLWALGVHHPNMLWYLKQVSPAQHKEGLPTTTPIGLVYQPELAQAPAVPSIPPSSIYPDMGWASLRSSWKQDATLLGVKSGFTWNHAHADASSYILLHKGEQIIKDGGNCWYASPLYPEYFFQSRAHNVVLFNGQAQPTEQQYYGSPLKGSLHHLIDGGNIKYVLANATGPTARYFSRNFRHFVWIDNVILIIDDVKAHEIGSFSWLVHPDGESKKVGADIQVVKNKASVLIRPLFPETLVDGGFDHDFPEKMKLKAIEAPIAKQTDKMETYYQVNYPEQVQHTKFITAIILKDSPESRDIPAMERLKGDNMQGVRITHKGKTTDVFLNLMADGRVMHVNAHNHVNGWDTDAYLTMVSYPTGTDGTDIRNIQELFVGYGSYIRKGTQPLYHSLSKLFTLVQKQGDTLDIHTSGQPLMNITLGCSQKPGAILINGQPHGVDYDNGRLRVAIQQ